MVTWNSTLSQQQTTIVSAAASATDPTASDALKPLDKRIQEVVKSLSEMALTLSLKNLDEVSKKFTELSSLNLQHHSILNCKLYCECLRDQNQITSIQSRITLLKKDFTNKTIQADDVSLYAHGVKIKLQTLAIKICQFIVEIQPDGFEEFGRKANETMSSLKPITEEDVKKIQKSINRSDLKWVKNRVLAKQMNLALLIDEPTGDVLKWQIDPFFQIGFRFCFHDGPIKETEVEGLQLLAYAGANLHSDGPERRNPFIDIASWANLNLDEEVRRLENQNKTISHHWARTRRGCGTRININIERMAVFINFLCRNNVDINEQSSPLADYLLLSYPHQPTNYLHVDRSAVQCFLNEGLDLECLPLPFWRSLYNTCKGLEIIPESAVLAICFGAADTQENENEFFDAFAPSDTQIDEKLKIFPMDNCNFEEEEIRNIKRYSQMARERLAEAVVARKMSIILFQNANKADGKEFLLNDVWSIVVGYLRQDFARVAWQVYSSKMEELEKDVKRMEAEREVMRSMTNIASFVLSVWQPPK